MARIPRDGCIVPAEPFADLLREFVDGWNRDRPQPGGQFGLEEEPPIRALAWLAAETGVTEGTLEGLLEQGERQKDWIELRLADKITTALDRTYVLCWVEVKPNPLATKRAQLVCCGGSDREQQIAA